MVEYYKNPEATAEVLDKEGWLYTGDMAQMDKDGIFNACLKLGLFDQ